MTRAQLGLGRLASRLLVLLGVLAIVAPAAVHDGCRLKFGPDGKVYASTGDAGELRLAQAREGDDKILRVVP